ncbi:hypothetical protein [Desulfurobacterium sp.]
MKLHFEESPVGFKLESDYDREDSLIGYYSYNPFSAQADAHPKTREVIYFSLVFYYPDVDPIEQLDVEIKYADEIPGLYTVPELGVKNATFKEVLEAVKKYYEVKLSQKQPTRTTA